MGLDQGTDPSDPFGMSTLQATPLDERPKLSLARSSDAPELDQRHFAALEEIVRLARPIRKAASFASFSGWATLLAGALTLPFSIGNIPMMVFCIVLAGIGTRELSLRRRLLKLETTVPRKLAINQLLLGGSLIAFAIFKLLQPTGESMVMSSIQSDPTIQSMPELASQFDGIAQLEHLVMAASYVIMILVALFVQGGSAIYYICKTRAMKRLHKRVPGWCVQVFSTVHG